MSLEKNGTHKGRAERQRFLKLIDMAGAEVDDDAAPDNNGHPYEKMFPLIIASSNPLDAEPAPRKHRAAPPRAEDLEGKSGTD